MAQFLALIGVQAMKYAIRSGIALTSTYALKQCSTLLKTVEDKRLHAEIGDLQRLLEDKIKVCAIPLRLPLVPLTLTQTKLGHHACHRLD